MEALVNHYRKPGETRNGEILLAEPEAPGSTRRCDLLRIGMWASRGTGIDVHEIKVSRSDWLRELDDPAKAEAWWPYCNRFWVVAPPGIVARPELPDGWGLLELPSRGRRFKAVVPAASKEAKLTVPLMVELLRRADNQRLNEMDGMRQQHREEMRRNADAWRHEAGKATLPKADRDRLDLAAKLEQALGVTLASWAFDSDRELTEATPADVAAALRDCVRDHLEGQRLRRRAEEDAARLARDARRFAERLLPGGAS